MIRKEEILAAAARALTAAPRSSMADIAAAIGIGRTTLHRHFENREALLLALAQWGVDFWEATVADLDVVVKSDDAELVRQGIADLVRAYAEHADQYGPTLTAFLPADLPDLEARISDIVGREERLYAHAQSLGVLRTDIPASWIGWSLFGLLVACRDSVRQGDIGHRAAADLVVTTFFEGNEHR